MAKTHRHMLFLMWYVDTDSRNIWHAVNRLVLDTALCYAGCVGNFVLYEWVTRKNKSLHPHIHSDACLCEYMSHGDWAHVSAILSRYCNFTSHFYDTYNISHKKTSSRYTPCYACVCMCMCMCVCLCACTCTCTSKDAERKCMFFKPFSCPLLSSVCLYVAHIHAN